MYTWRISYSICIVRSINKQSVLYRKIGLEKCLRRQPFTDRVTIHIMTYDIRSSKYC
jgi:hypothetical protein